MRIVFATLLALLASFPAMALTGGTYQSYSDQTTKGLHRLDDDTSAPARYGSVEVSNTPFWFDSRRAVTDRRGLGPRVRSQQSECRVRATDISDRRPLKRGRACLG